MTPPDQFATWADFGFAGALAGALILGAGMFVRYLINQIERMQEGHREERREWRDSQHMMDQQREERARLRDEHYVRALNDLTQAVRGKGD